VAAAAVAAVTALAGLVLLGSVGRSDSIGVGKSVA